MFGRSEDSQKIKGFPVTAVITGSTPLVIMMMMMMIMMTKR